MKKPPYRVPSMEEIAAVKGKNGYTVVSTFSGCGGSCLGFEMAGFKILWASEFNEAARRIYKLNHPGTFVDPRDIREIQPEEILKQTGCTIGEIDVFEGSPPCDSFTLGGARHKLWGKVKNYSDSQKRQRTDDLFFEYLRLVKGLRPRVFVAENVAGLVVGKAKGYFKRVLREMRELGYHTGAKILDAQWLGVPQARKRVIFIGSLNGHPMWPKPSRRKYTLKDAFEISLQSGDRVRPSKRISRWWHQTQPGRYIKEGCRTAGESGCGQLLRRLSWDIPSYTLLQDPKRLLHPDMPASLTIPEAKRVGSFPDDFRLIGTFNQQYARIGLSVPPVMAFHIARCVERMLRKEDEHG